MSYKVVSFSPSISGSGSSDDVAKQMESVIQQMANDGWTFVSHAASETRVSGSSGCFGLGAKPDSSTQFQFLVFKK